MTFGSVLVSHLKKEDLVSKVRESVEEYRNAFVVSFENIRSGPFKVVANQWREDSRFYLGKNKVIQVALGKKPEDEPADNTHLQGGLQASQLYA